MPKLIFLRAGIALILVAEASALASEAPLVNLIQSAREHSPILQKAEAERKEGEWKQAEGFSSFLPTLTLNANHFFEKKFQVLNVNFGVPAEFPMVFPTSSATLSARWLLFDGLANLNLYRSATRAKDAAKAQAEWAGFKLDRDVTLAYFQWVASKILHEVFRENSKTLETHLSQVKSLKEAGLATAYDILKVESQWSEAQAELLQASDNVEITKDRLAVLLGGTLPAGLAETPLPEPDVSRVSSLEFNPESKGRLDLIAMEQQAQAAESLDAASSFFWVPRLSLGADYIKYNNLSDPLSDWEKYRNAWNVGFFLSWTLFNPREFSQAKQNQYRALEAMKGIQQTRIQAPADFNFWKKRYLYSASLYAAKKADLKRAQETVRLAEAGFKAGIRTTTEVLDAELELFRARGGIVNSQVNCLEAKIKLELSLGEPL